MNKNFGNKNRYLPEFMNQKIKTKNTLDSCVNHRMLALIKSQISFQTAHNQYNGIILRSPPKPK